MKKETEKKFFLGLPGNIIALGAVSFLTDASSEMIYPILPLFLTVTLGAGPALIGIIEGIAESTASLLKFFSGYFSDRVRKRRPIILSGYSLSTLARPLIALAGAWWQVLVIRFSDRVGKGIRSSPRDALIADSVDAANYGKAYGFHRSMDHAGAVAGPILATLILAYITSDYRSLFLLAAIPGILSLLVILFFVKETRIDRKGSSQPLTFSLKNFDSGFKMLLASVIVFTLGNSSDAFLLLRAKEAGVPAHLIPAIWAVLHIVKTLSSTPGGVMSDRVGRKRIIIAGWLVYGLVYLGFAYASSHLHIWILFIIYGIYFGMTEGVEKAFVADLVPQHLRGTAFGLYNFAIGISALPASLLFGVIWQKAGMEYAFMTGAGIAMVASVMLLGIKIKRM
ncbi:MAG: MFS transporter [Candidatus Schekmanbacteria bacterium RIFCSPHIGHO2_02_FULL_38_11]|uniref:MFS transporter n=1 Tax=Candidatus Schekmanbacteria bacterium RIFCSPLOWO2_12_FULL_38_15 TaxID=1817883 RepID=A0A1F7SMJ9_9BACT|nr:MAG: MFS transporter [Candidatus Schekmanbacteria bacterium RIFCSPLOWO2_12_FULL_38_15]OGL54644.1 MAG: MFS transporter [Candidatus Schekmanbacteria bacterium RIFCSPHIGHO2_02_FULL_38_11]